MIANAISVTEFHTKTDMSRWTRAHADAPGINWSTQAGPGGTMILIEHEDRRDSLPGPAVPAQAGGAA